MQDGTPTKRNALFAGGYGPAETPAIRGFLFDPDAPALIPETAFAGIANPSFITVHPNGRWLYAVSEIGRYSHNHHGAVWAFAIEHAPLRLTPLNERSSGGDAPCHLALDRSGDWLAVSNYVTGDAALFPLRPDGSLGERRALVRHAGRGPNPDRQEAPHAHSAIFTPDNRFLIVADLGIDRLMVYAFDAAVGTLTQHVAVPTAPGAGPRHTVFHPNGTVLYVANELDCTVTAYSFDAAAGALRPAEIRPTLPAGASDSTVADIHLSADARHLYVSNRGHNSVAVFALAPDGALTPRGVYPCGGDWPRNFAVSPDGGYLLVANRRSNGIAVLPLSADGAVIGDAVHHAAVPEATCVHFLSGGARP